MRIAAFGFRSLPPSNGAAGADKFVLELLPRLVSKGHAVTAYNRKYPDASIDLQEYKGVRIKTFKTVNRKGFDTLIHSLKCTVDIIVNNTADIVHIQNGGNSIWCVFLRMFGKKVFISQDGVDWKRKKWPWYGKIYLKFSSYITAHIPNMVIFDNVIAKNYFEKKFGKSYEFIPFGSEMDDVQEDKTLLERFGLKKNEYYLFVGRFIPDKGLHYLIPAFQKANTNRKLVLVGGCPNPSPYEKQLHEAASDKIVFTGFVYGDDVNRLMRGAYCYIQPSDVEGLSPVVLSVMGLGVPLIVSDIEENLYAVKDTAIAFRRADIESLKEQIEFADQHTNHILQLGARAKTRALNYFNWQTVTEEHIDVFSKY
ncbi:MAG TPA: glycosyltransferase family 4 protein [Flavitalea sp.]|nr:glycosyltransferase family 4 protein [Flavitalea sp.]